MSMLPRAPRSANATDFVVIVFVVTVATILMISTVATVIAAVFTDRDVTQFTGALLDIITTIIGALIGFIAGKGQGRAEVHDEQAAAKADEP